MNKKIKWHKHESTRKFTLTVPIDFVIAIGGNEKEDLDVNLRYDIPTQSIIIQNANYDKNVLSKVKNTVDTLKKISKYKYPKDKYPVKYKIMKNKKIREIKEKQIANGSIEAFRNRLMKNEEYIIEDGVLKKMNKEERNRQLDLLGRD